MATALFQSITDSHLVVSAFNPSIFEFLTLRSGFNPSFPPEAHSHAYTGMPRPLCHPFRNSLLDTKFC
jgi:hypothetical protein